ncbi:glutathione S-transferase family protein [Roseovarius phycicola]|uniref:Glutathione S-transferase family protein n=1 Tax=Roseovarius phycicola TaxID=3080976 RepID=A0ABZ2HDS6_9RHOB
MYKLYYATGSASMGVRVVLEDIGVPYELLDTTIEPGEPRPDAQLAVNPNGWVPVLLWDGGAMYEAAAITVFLCDRHPEAGLAPAVDAPERAQFLQTLVYFSNTVQTAYQQTYYPDRFVEDAALEADAVRRGCRRLRESWGVIDRQIGEGRWVLGERFSAADIYLYMLTTWLSDAKGHPQLAEFPNVARVAGAVAERESVQRVYGI